MTTIHQPHSGHDLRCFLSTYGIVEHGDPMPACEGRLIRAHLIPKQMLKSSGDVWHPSSFVWACGGVTGVGGHHGMFDSSRTLRLPREAIPAGTEALAAFLGLTWWLDKTYGERAWV